jgi:hypothetical protein
MSKGFSTPCLMMLMIIYIGMQSTISAQLAGMPPMGNVYGYVILSNGDTLPGLIKWKLKYVENNLAEITFTAKNGNSKDFKAGDIPGFGYKLGASINDFSRPEDPGYQNYESVPSLKKEIPVFISRLINGRIKVFQNRRQIYFSGKDEEPSGIEGILFTFIPDKGLFIGPAYKPSNMIIGIMKGKTSYLVRKDRGKLLKVDKKNYADAFPALFGDCPDIGKELGKNPGLAEFKNFIIG